MRKKLSKSKKDIRKKKAKYRLGGSLNPAPSPSGPYPLNRKA